MLPSYPEACAALATSAAFLRESKGPLLPQCHLFPFLRIGIIVFLMFQTVVNIFITHCHRVKVHLRIV